VLTARCPRSGRTVDAEGNALDGQLNALFHHLLLTLTNHYITLSSCAYAATGRWNGSIPSNDPAPLVVAQPLCSVLTPRPSSIGCCDRVGRCEIIRSARVALCPSPSAGEAWGRASVTMLGSLTL
jgi:hypothetical protein